MKSRLRWVAGLVAVFALVVSPAYAEEGDGSVGSRKWIYSVTLGSAEWQDLADIQSVRGGSFDSRGFALELAMHKPLWRWGSADVLLGVDLGIITTDGDIPGVFENLTQRSGYLTPSMKFRFGEYGRKYFSIEAGIGSYQTDFAELECDGSSSICIELNDPFNANAVGDYVGVTAGLGKWFTTGLKVHFADFGSVRNISGVSGSLGGPIYVLSVGGTFGG